MYCKDDTFVLLVHGSVQGRSRAVDLGGLSVYQGGPKFESKHKSRCLQKIKLVNGGGGQACRLGGPGPPGAGPGSMVGASSNGVEFLGFRCSV